MANNTAPMLTIRDGWVTTDFGPHRFDGATRAFVQQDGKLLVAGISDGLVALARYNPNGSLDWTFSNDGKLTADLGAGLNGADFALQPDGTITAFRHTYSGLNISHFRSNGELDTSFGTNGILTSADSSGISSIFSLVPLGDGKIVTAGSKGDDFVVRRYNSDGTFDKSFGTNGEATVDIGAGDLLQKMLVQPDGKILFVGQAASWPSPEYSLVRLNSNGTLDTSFSGDGKLTLVTSGSAGMMRGAMALQSDGKIVIGTPTTIPDGTGVTLFRYKTDGSLDTTFHGTGSVTLGGAGFESNDVTAISIQQDGKIFAFGNATDGASTPYVFVARFLPGGSIDQTFGTKGVAYAAKPAGASGTNMLVQPDGKIVVTGSIRYGTNDYTSDVDFATMRFNADGSVDQTFSAFSNAGIGTQVFVEANATSTGLPVVLNNNIQVYDLELAATVSYNGASLTLMRHGGAKTDDVFSAKPGGTLSALKAGSDLSVDGVTIGRVTANAKGTLTLTFTAKADQASVNKAMQQIAYANTSDTPPEKVMIDWTFSDGNTGAQGTGGIRTTVGSTAVTIIATNDAPVVHQQLPDQKITTSAAFRYAIPESAFTDPDHDAININVVTADGKVLPSWLSFDASTLTLSGTPNTTDAGALKLQVIAKDGSGSAVSNYFTLNIVPKSLHIDGTGGADNLVGAAGDDVLQGFAGNDTLDGKAGADTMVGGDGNDAYYVDNAGDIVSEAAAGGTDIVYTTIASYQLTPNVEYARVLSSGKGNLIGNELANVLYASDGDNVLDGGLGTDTAAYASATAAVTVSLATTVAQNTKGSGADTLLHIENLTGSNFNDNLTGNQNNNTLNGGAGADTMSGGLGNDTYYVDNAGDVVAEVANGGTDTVISTVTRTLGDNQENLTLAGTAAINGTGNSLDNTITGNSARNVLTGGTGADKMVGGLGDDFYYVDNAGDLVVESADPTLGGNDTVSSTITFTLGNYVENLTLGGTAAINGTGNALANKLVGNGEANVLSGGDGADTLVGGLGNDTLVGGQGKDVLEGGSGSDAFVLNAASDTATTSAGWDVINDFVRGQDKIDLRGIDANTATTANDAFTGFIAGTAAFTAAGQLKLVGGVLYGNTDADADAEFAIQLTGITQLTTADVML
jgi:uncharacterized delta-60 repeat protein